MTQHRTPQGQLRLRSDISAVSLPSLEGQWDPDPLEFAQGDILPDSQTTDAWADNGTFSLALLSAQASELVISEIRILRVHSQTLQKVERSKAPGRKNHLEGVLCFDSR